MCGRDDSCLKMALREFECSGGKTHVSVRKKGNKQHEQLLSGGGFT